MIIQLFTSSCGCLLSVANFLHGQMFHGQSLIGLGLPYISATSSFLWDAMWFRQAVYVQLWSNKELVYELSLHTV